MSSHAILAAPAVAHVPGVAAVPTLTAVHSQRLIPQPPAVHSVASPTTVLQTVQTGNAVVGHQKVGDQVVGKTPDVNGYAFRSDVRHDAPVHLPAAPAPAIAYPAPAPAPVAVAAPAPAVAVAAPAPAPLPLVQAVPAPIPTQTVHPAPPAQVKSYSVETGHQIAHDHVVTSPVIRNTVHSPVIGQQPIIGQVPVAAPVVAAPAPIAYPAPVAAPPAY